MLHSNTDNATTMELYLERTLYACCWLLAPITTAGVHPVRAISALNFTHSVRYSGSGN